MNRSTVAHFGHRAAYRRAHDAISRPDPFERENPLTRRAALIIVLLSSLGLWWVIWLAASSLASALSQ
jgi:hypothetical protein